MVGIEVVDKEAAWIVQAEEEVVNGASRMLLQGMETQVRVRVSQRSISTTVTN